MAKQRLREARIQAIDYLILLLAGACLGLIAKSGDESFGAAGYTYTVIATCELRKYIIQCIFMFFHVALNRVLIFHLQFLLILLH